MSDAVDPAPEGDPGPSSYLEFVQNGDGQWYWRHKARNHEQLSRSSETYREERDAAHGARLSLGAERIERMEVKRFPYEAGRGE